MIGAGWLGMSGSLTRATDEPVPVDMVTPMLDGMINGMGMLITSVVTNPTSLAIVVILLLLAAVSRLVPAKRGRRR